MLRTIQFEELLRFPMGEPEYKADTLIARVVSARELEGSFTMDRDGNYTVPRDFPIGIGSVFRMKAGASYKIVIDIESKAKEFIAQFITVELAPPLRRAGVMLCDVQVLDREIELTVITNCRIDLSDFAPMAYVYFDTSGAADADVKKAIAKIVADLRAQEAKAKEEAAALTQAAGDPNVFGGAGEAGTWAEGGAGEAGTWAEGGAGEAGTGAEGGACDPAANGEGSLMDEMIAGLTEEGPAENFEELDAAINKGSEGSPGVGDAPATNNG